MFSKWKEDLIFVKVFPQLGLYFYKESYEFLFLLFNSLYFYCLDRFFTQLCSSVLKSRQEVHPFRMRLPEFFLSSNINYKYHLPWWNSSVACMKWVRLISSFTYESQQSMAERIFEFTIMADREHNVFFFDKWCSLYFVFIFFRIINELEIKKYFNIRW
jgi:hypothetical protein